MKYKRKELLDAIQYTGQNKRDVATWMYSLGSKKFCIDRSGNMVITSYSGPIIVKPWYYILHDAHYGYSILSQIEFDKKFEAVSQ